MVIGSPPGKLSPSPEPPPRLPPHPATTSASASPAPAHFMVMSVLPFETCREFRWRDSGRLGIWTDACPNPHLHRAIPFVHHAWWVSRHAQQALDRHHTRFLRLSA